MTDYKQLCVELVELGSSPARSVSELAERMSQVMDLADRARAALAEPEPEGPTDDELDELFTEIDQSGEPESWRAYASAVLARWGNHPESPDRSGNLKAGLTRSPAAGEVAELVAWLQDRAAGNDRFGASIAASQMNRAADLLKRLSPPQPVSVSKRLPGLGDCDAEGECYWFDPEGSGAWYQDTYQGNYSHWLPAHALPLPSSGEGEA